MNFRPFALLAFISPIVLPYASSQTARPTLAASSVTAVPPLILYSGQVESRTGQMFATFLIYQEQSGGEPLFTESQALALDATGHYKVQLGASNPNGLPSDLFSSGEARWLEVQIAGEPAQPRVLLVSVPYALKAADSAMLGGLPASAFALAGSNTGLVDAATATISPDASAPTVTTTGGTANNLAKFSGTSTIVNSIIYDNGTDVGIGTTSPSAKLTVDGTMTVDGASTLNGTVTLPAQGTATAAKADSSQPFKLYTSAYNSSSRSVVTPRFQLMAEVTGNDTSSPNGTLNLLASPNASAPAETGFYINTNGTIHFAPNQTFPGADITGTVNASSYDLGGSLFATGSASMESAYLGFSGNTKSTGIENTGTGYLALSSDTTGTDNTATGALALFSNTTGGYNTATGLVALYANTTGQSNTANGASTLTNNADGSYNTANGFTALTNNTDGSQNTASGAFALYENTTGDDNTAVGAYSLLDNTTGSFLTAVGYEATSSGSAVINNSTALGANATVGQSNSLILGQTTDGEPGASFVNVGIGTATPRTTLEVAVNAPNALGPVLTLTNSGEGGSAIDFNTSQPLAGATYTPAARIVAYDNGTIDSGSGSRGIAMQSRAGQGLQNNLVVDGNGVHVPGALEGGVNNSKIDHPLDPANKYLVHSSVQSSEMMNIYTGNIVTDGLGLATVKLPEWFEAENSDFRYQLTVLDERFAQAVISKKIKNGQFTIHTNASNVEVSWQITAIRQDAYAKAHPLVVEQQKPAGERNFYLHPELYGKSAERQAGASHIYGQPASAVGKSFPVPPRPETKLPVLPATNRPGLPNLKDPTQRPATTPVAQLATK